MTLKVDLWPPQACMSRERERQRQRLRHLTNEVIEIKMSSPSLTEKNETQGHKEMPLHILNIG